MMSASNIQWVVMDQNVLLQNINFKKNVKTKSLGDCAAHKVFQYINDIVIGRAGLPKRSYCQETSRLLQCMRSYIFEFGWTRIEGITGEIVV